MYWTQVKHIQHPAPEKSQRRQLLLWPVLHCHAFAQRPLAAGRHVSGWRCDQGEEHVAGLQELHYPLDGRPHAGCQGGGRASQKKRCTHQAGTSHGCVPTGTSLPDKQACMWQPSCSCPNCEGCCFSSSLSSLACNAERANCTWRACCPGR